MDSWTSSDRWCDVSLHYTSFETQLYTILPQPGPGILHHEMCPTGFLVNLPAVAILQIFFSHVCRSVSIKLLDQSKNSNHDVLNLPTVAQECQVTALLKNSASKSIVHSSSKGAGHCSSLLMSWGQALFLITWKRRRGRIFASAYWSFLIINSYVLDLSSGI